VLAWLAWGLLILVLRYNVERKHQLNAAEEAREALRANI
jgi:heme exporter protein C